jgi:hypothetical protein
MRLTLHRMARWLAVSALFSATAKEGARAAYVDFGVSAATGIMEFYPTNNAGADRFFACGTIQNVACGGTNTAYACRNRALLRFDVASHIPAGSRIRSVSLLIWMTLQPPNDETDPNAWFDFHRLLMPWNEGAGRSLTPGASVGRGALPGEVCWDYRSFPTVPWSIPGGAAGVDYDAAVSGSAYITAVPSDSPFLAYAVSNRLVQDFQFWLDHPEQNHGWLMKAQRESDRWTAKRFMTPESNIDDYPRVEVIYTPPPVIESIQTNGSNLTFQFEADAGQVYQVQFRDDLASGTWFALTNIAAPVAPTNVVIRDAINPASPQRFYRVVAP